MNTKQEKLDRIKAYNTYAHKWNYIKRSLYNIVDNQRFELIPKNIDRFTVALAIFHSDICAAKLQILNGDIFLIVEYKFSEVWFTIKEKIFKIDRSKTNFIIDPKFQSEDLEIIEPEHILHLLNLKAELLQQAEKITENLPKCIDFENLIL